LTLCSRGGGFGDGGQRFLFEVRPDLFPQGWLTPLEIGLWAKFYNRLDEKRKK
jgi:hypothetical protein